MTTLAASPDLLATSPTTTAAELAKRGDIKKTAQDFESSFLTVMLQSMFKGVTTPTPFGGGEGEDMFKSFFTEAMAKQITRAGGIGVADAVGKEMLRLQGLTPTQ